MTWCMIKLWHCVYSCAKITEIVQIQILTSLWSFQTLLKNKVSVSFHQVIKKCINRLHPLYIASQVRPLFHQLYLTHWPPSNLCRGSQQGINFFCIPHQLEGFSSPSACFVLEVKQCRNYFETFILWLKLWQQIKYIEGKSNDASQCLLT